MSPASPVAHPEHVELDIDGMTCASCAARIEKRLNRLEGVQATVNFATETARVEHGPSVSTDDLVAQVEAIGYHARVPLPPQHGDTHEGAGAHAGDGGGGHVHPDDDPAELRTRLLVSALLSLPVVLVAMIPALQFRNWQWASLTLAAPVVVWGGRPFHVATWRNLRHGAVTMDTLISVGTIAAFGWSVYALFWGHAGMTGMKMGFDLTVKRGEASDHLYLEAATAVTTFLLAGRFFEARAKRRSGAALRALLALGAKDVAVLRDGTEVRVDASTLVVGDRFVVRPGEKVATDGVVESGASAVDASLVTGESVPVDVGPGDAVTGATVNVGGRLVVQATRVGADTQLARIARLVTEAQGRKAAVQRLADRISTVFVPTVIVLAVATLVGWLLSGAGSSAAFSAAVAVLIIACPCALGLATPTALLVGTGRGAQLGILIRGPEVLESTRRVDTVVLDKTGTVTTGRMSLVGVTALDGVDTDEVLRLVGAVEDASEHPVANAIARGAAERVGDPLPVESFRSREGLGAEGVVDGHAVVVGRPALLADWGLELPAELQAARTAAQAAGQTSVVAAWDGAVRAVLTVADTLKPTSAEAIAGLRAQGLSPVLLTGDSRGAAETVAAEVGIDEVVAEVLPADKVEAIRRLQDQGRVVAMVGDGVNDAAALAQADLGIAMGTGADAAIEASDLTLVRGDLRVVSDAIRLSRRTLGTIRANLFWAFAYNVAAIPLAMAGLLNPVIAGGAMALSSVFVVSNSLRLRRFH